MKLKKIVPWGRSFEEYKQMFALTSEDLRKSILGCGDGPASFNATLTAQGGKVVSVDPIYQFNAQEIRLRISEVYNEVMSQVLANKDHYVWHSIPSVTALGKMRMDAMNVFIADYDEGKEARRYINESLPKLSFENKQFDLALCSHYLFLYTDHISREEHIASVKELCRVAKEVRIYPLVSLDGKLSSHLDLVRDNLDQSNLRSSLVDVSYHFQKGATQMLVVQSI